MKKFLALFLIGLSIAGCTAPASSQGDARQAAPDFSVNSLDGQMLKPSSMKGKVVLLDFWATWCPPCREEIPHFKELYTQYKDKGVQIIGLALDEDGEASVRPFAQQNQINYPLAIATQEIVSSFGGIRGIPTTYILDKQGNIAKKWVGYQDKAVFEKEIQTLLAE